MFMGNASFHCCFTAAMYQGFIPFSRLFRPPPRGWANLPASGQAHLYPLIPTYNNFTLTIRIGYLNNEYEKTEQWLVCSVDR